MQVSQLETIFRCPICQGKVHHAENGFVCVVNNHLSPVIGNNIVVESPVEQSADWQRQQGESVERYSDETYEEDRRMASLFGNFIAVSVDKGAPVLDIGCGLFPEEPSYVSNLGLGQYIGMEPIDRVVERDYICLVGAVAEAIPVESGTIGAAIFATSLDHIETVHEAIQEVCRTLKPSGSLYFWNGMHDPALLAEAKSFGNIVNRSKGWRRAARILGAQVEYAVLLRQMSRTRKDLKAGKPLDHAHVRYYTTDTIGAAMTSYGLKIVRQILVPSSNSHFIEAKPIYAK